jgi:hypothetical protein
MKGRTQCGPFSRLELPSTLQNLGDDRAGVHKLP